LAWPCVPGADLDASCLAGGLGKSTLAKAMYNELLQRGSFSCSAFVEIAVGDDDSTLPHLKAALRALGAAAEDAEGIFTIRGRLQEYVKHRAVLFVLDNVWNLRQLQDLLPVEWGAGSRVIVTSRFSEFQTMQQVSACSTPQLVQPRALVLAVGLFHALPATATCTFMLRAGTVESICSSRWH
jgi:hypothetical protein